MPSFTSPHALLLGPVGLVASVAASHYYTCTTKINVVQAQVDARVAAIAGAGPVPRESAAAPAG